ncbi:SMI1/KNR4 family protein [Saccharopolyspora indica]|nr:SMI1/KNR4 family protein [Saccharopolyspora indica]
MTGPRTADLSEALREMCAQITRAAPEGWVRAAVNGFVDKQGVGRSAVSYQLATGAEETAEVDLRRALRQAYRATGASEQGLSIGLTAEASGRFDAVTGLDVSRVEHPERGFLHVIAPDAPPPDPGDEQDGPADPAPAGDPDEAVQLLREYLRRRAEILGVVPESPFGVLPSPLPPEQLEAVENALNVALPADLRALYGVADGDGQLGIFGRLSWWMDAAGMAEVHRGDRHWAPRTGRNRPFLPFIHDADPPGTVRRSVDRPGWIPFVIGTDGNYLAVDADPASGGRPGQVIRIGPSHHQGPTYVADSVTSLLRRYVDALIRGDHSRDGDGGLRIAVPDPHVGAGPHLQRLRVTDGNLEPARRAPFLRAVELSRASADLTALHDAPVEALDIDLRDIDLTPLTAHPTLRAITLTTPHPVDLSPLTTLPRLEVLDLARGRSHDLRPIAELNLRHLALRHEQWRELWVHTDRMPSLESALLAGKPSYDEVASWIQQVNTRTTAQQPTADV